MEQQQNISRATVVLIPFKNDGVFFHTLKMVQKARGEFRILVMDNNKDHHLEPLLKDHDVIYRWNGNQKALAGATNKALDIIKTEYFVYVCTNHCHVYDDTWLETMVWHMDNMPKEIVMAGDLQPFQGKKHVQGGVFIARTKELREIRYDDKKYPFSFMDVNISNRIRKAGYKIGKIPSVRSVMYGYRDVHHNTNMRNKKFKIVHCHEYFNKARARKQKPKL